MMIEKDEEVSIMNRITLTIAGFLLASGTFAMATVAYGADRGDRKESLRAVSHESSHEGKRDSSRERDRHEGDRDSDSHMTNGTSRDVKLSNLSNRPIDDIDVSFSGKDAEDFRQTNDCGHELNGGGSCTISVIFRPRSRGEKSATMEVHSSGGDQKVDLTGTGT
jgi:hypothetical protein